jgi:hypothetical protein
VCVCVRTCACACVCARAAVLVYAYMFLVAKTYEIPFLPWASATLFWVALICALLAVCNTCAYIHHFTRFSGELFGLLIAVLFLQQVSFLLAFSLSSLSMPHPRCIVVLLLSQ